MTTFGDHLRALRKQQDLTLRELAELVDVDFTYLSKLENGKLPPPADDTILRLSTALHADPDDLFGAARKVPGDLKHHVREAPPEAALLLRKLTMQRLTQEQYRRMLAIFSEEQEGDATHGK